MLDLITFLFMLPITLNLQMDKLADVVVNALLILAVRLILEAFKSHKKVLIKSRKRNGKSIK